MSEHRFRSVGSNVRIYPGARILGAENITIGSNVIIDDFVMIQAAQPMVIGNYVHIASFTSITGGGVCVMEDFTTLSSGVRVFTGTDDFSGATLANSTIPPEFRGVRRSRAVLRRHAIVGANSVILPGAVIGEGVAVGAASLVRHDLEPWWIYAGNPLKRIRPRLKDELLAMEARLFARDGRPEREFREVA